MRNLIITQLVKTLTVISESLALDAGNALIIKTSSLQNDTSLTSKVCDLFLISLI